MNRPGGVFDCGMASLKHQLRHIAAWGGGCRRTCTVSHLGAQQPESLCNETPEAHFTRGERDLHLMSLTVGQCANQTIVSSPVNRFLDIPDAHHFTPFLLCQVSGHFGKRRIPGRTSSGSRKHDLAGSTGIGGACGKFNVDEKRPPFVPQSDLRSNLRWCAATLGLSAIVSDSSRSPLQCGHLWV